MKEFFDDLILRRQSCRDFNDQPLTEKTVMEIAKSAMKAPSACNSQPWKMYVVTTPERVALTAKALGVNGHNKFISKAKAFIVFAEKKAELRAGVSFDGYHFVKYDIGEIIAYATLSAESMGVKSCIIGMVDQALIGDAVGLKEGEKCNLAIALGYSDCKIREKKRKSEDEVIELI